MPPPGANIICGGVYDDALADSLRVTVVATGLGAPSAARQPKPQLVASKTGTDNLPGPVNYQQLDAVPAVMSRRNPAPGRLRVQPLDCGTMSRYSSFQEIAGPRALDVHRTG